MDISEEFNKQVNGVFKIIDGNRIFSAVLSLFLILYASLAAPTLPKSITNIFRNTWFKLIFMFLIAYISTKNPSVAIISSVALLITLQTLHAQDTTNTILTSVEHKITENFKNFNTENEKIPVPAADTDNYNIIEDNESVSCEEEESNVSCNEDSNNIIFDDLLNSKPEITDENNIPVNYENTETPVNCENIETPANNEIIETPPITENFNNNCEDTLSIIPGYEANEFASF